MIEVVCKSSMKRLVSDVASARTYALTKPSPSKGLCPKKMILPSDFLKTNHLFDFPHDVAKDHWKVNSLK
jgi:hypothetical protein